MNDGTRYANFEVRSDDGRYAEYEPVARKTDTRATRRTARAGKYAPITTPSGNSAK